MKTLAMCPQCGSQYDVTGRVAGESLRCHCGALFTVPEPRVEDARVVRCPSCGAARSGDQEVCSFCGSRFSMADKGWGSMCPHCLCRLPVDAQFCVECGLRIDPQPWDSTPTGMGCPRCSQPLHARQLGEIQVCECGSCGGLWVSQATFQWLCKEHEKLAAALLPGKHEPTRFEIKADEPVRYLPCPRCGNIMNRQNFGWVSGVIIDSCRDCGIWLDNQELGEILQFLESGGAQRAAEFEEEQRIHARRMEMASPGWSEPGTVGEALLTPMGRRDSFDGLTQSDSPLIRALGWVARALLS